ncbi:hypothetical protein C8A00DRAFT_30576 [Chaetomidium leptoderma]|uniref:Uncharacterized protein n=1 Tax=Chaetomidium leptoderma TaxID=669021 RepID=A0AAN6ZZK1_9PEZI|nr:hypothetical protein C8A00DRAFT_30576 [Chaetomidium leptoderma]
MADPQNKPGEEEVDSFVVCGPRTPNSFETFSLVGGSDEQEDCPSGDDVSQSVGVVESQETSTDPTATDANVSRDKDGANADERARYQEMSRWMNEERHGARAELAWHQSRLIQMSRALEAARDDAECSQKQLEAAKEELEVTKAERDAARKSSHDAAFEVDCLTVSLQEKNAALTTAQKDLRCCEERIGSLAGRQFTMDQELRAAQKMALRERDEASNLAKALATVREQHRTAVADAARNIDSQRLLDSTSKELAALVKSAGDMIDTLADRVKMAAEKQDDAHNQLMATLARRDEEYDTLNEHLCRIHEDVAEVAEAQSATDDLICQISMDQGNRFQVLCRVEDKLDRLIKDWESSGDDDMWNGDDDNEDSKNSEGGGAGEDGENGEDGEDGVDGKDEEHGEAEEYDEDEENDEAREYDENEEGDVVVDSEDAYCY